MMLRRTLNIMMLVLVAAVASAQVNLSAYEYWIDGHYDQRTTGISNEQELALGIDLSELPDGLHFFNFRAKDSNEQWGSMQRYAFMRTATLQDNIIRYETWMDNDFDHRQLIEQTGDSLVQVVDISALGAGAHFYNLRAQNAEGYWGPVQRYMIFVAEPDASAQVAAVRYWLDDDTLNISEKATRGITVDVTMDVSHLPAGTHSFSCYLQNILGDTTDVYHYDFELGYVATPVITHAGNTFTLSTTTPGATIHYTLDNSRPTQRSRQYTESFRVTDNDTIRAVAVRPGWIDSEEARFVVNWFTDPIDPEPVEQEWHYCDSVATGFTYIAAEIEHHDAEVAEWHARQRVYCDTLRAMLTCCTLDTVAKTTAYWGEVLQIEDRLTDISEVMKGVQEEREALLTLADSLRAADSLLIATLGEATSKAQVDSLGRLMSQHRQRYDEVARRLDQLLATAEAQLALMPALTVQMKDIEQGIVVSTTAISVSYTLRKEQLLRLHRYPKLRHLDLKRASMENDALPDSIFMGLQQLVVAEMPVNVISVGTGLFAECPRLAAIVWHCTGIVADRRVLRGIDNPNLLLYVGSHALVRDVDIINVVIDGVAEKIVLTDGDTPGQNINFCAPLPFHVSGDISYTHRYDQTSGYGECRGWETIALPFNVQTVTHETRGTCVPFAAYQYPLRPFWLCQLTEQGFEDAGGISAHTPYIISMPNNEHYSPFYQLNGSVTFAAHDTDVAVTTQLVSHRGATSFIPVFEQVEAAPQVFALNVGEPADGDPEGSVFISDYADVRPFQGYRQTTEPGVQRIGIASDLEAATQGIIDISVTPGKQPTFNLRGMSVQTPHKGVYIKGGRKVIKR